MKKIALYSLILGLVAAAPSLQANDLNKIQEQIKAQQSKIAEQRKKRDALQSTLKSQETEMNKVINRLKETELSLSEIRKTIATTEKEIKALEKQEKEQKERLKEQLDSAYRSGIHPSILERLLSDDAKEADRMGAYYEHINQIRVETIQALRRTQAQLKEQRDALKAQQAGKQTQLNAQKKQEKDLKKVQAERETTIRSIDKTLERDADRLDALKSNEAALRNRLAQAEKEAKQEAERQEKQALANLEKKKNNEEKRAATEKEKQEVKQQVRAQTSSGTGLGKAAKQYPMPVSGKIVTQFGGYWHGIVIQAPSGTPVRAIADGRVINTEWINGYGPLVVISHGNDYLTSYGYNQAVHVRKGDRVKAGQVIASVGNSGGQRQSGLYFDIRHKGVAQNPARWLK
ncbi:hypothetical protein A4G20_07370 [Pasteurellaceae bacterium RH1A]|nr:hypothetical protein A4G20_07370 [Pasteurellaceae bacterium RH1A]